MAEWPPAIDHRGEDDAHLSDEVLSAYIDGEIGDRRERSRARAHLAACPQCRRALGELRGVVSLLADLPAPEPPRSFQLRPEMVPLRLPPAAPWYLRMQPALRRAAAVAAVLLAFLLVADLALGPVGGVDEADPAIVGPAAVADDARPIADSDESEERAVLEAQEAAPTPEAAGEEAAAGVEAFTAPAEGATEAALDRPAVADEGPSILDLVQIALALIVAWLLVLTVVIPRARARPPGPTVLW